MLDVRVRQMWGPLDVWTTGIFTYGNKGSRKIRRGCEEKLFRMHQAREGCIEFIGA